MCRICILLRRVHGCGLLCRIYSWLLPLGRIFCSILPGGSLTGDFEITSNGHCCLSVTWTPVCLPSLLHSLAQAFAHRYCECSLTSVPLNAYTPSPCFHLRFSTPRLLLLHLPARHLHLSLPFHSLSVAFLFCSYYFS